jgi:hypothetical protein
MVDAVGRAIHLAETNDRVQKEYEDVLALRARRAEEEEEERRAGFVHGPIRDYDLCSVEPVEEVAADSHSLDEGWDTDGDTVLESSMEGDEATDRDGQEHQEAETNLVCNFQVQSPSSFSVAESHVGGTPDSADLHCHSHAFVLLANANTPNAESRHAVAISKIQQQITDYWASCPDYPLTPELSSEGKLGVSHLPKWFKSLTSMSITTGGDPVYDREDCGSTELGISTCLQFHQIRKPTVEYTDVYLCVSGGGDGRREGNSDQVDHEEKSLAPGLRLQRNLFRIPYVGTLPNSEQS